MRPNCAQFLCIVTLLIVATVTLACKTENRTQSVAAAVGAGKIPITTTSDQARAEFLAGRDLAERLLGQESLQHFDRALALDPDFALAELARANNSPTAKEFFAHQLKATILADKASEGEKLLILANEAGSNGEVVKQKEYLEKLVAAYPGDERAQFSLANYCFGQQDYSQAVEHYKKATELNPTYSPAYNVLGYAYRQQGDYANAELAFKKYVELIPQDPNPYDSYAELLLKMGRFDDSIAQYHKALSIDPQFVPSHFGLSADFTYAGKPEAAMAELETMAQQARNDGELRTAYFGMAVVESDEGQFDKALEAIAKQYGVAEKKNDTAAMAGDLQAKGNILMAAKSYDAAAKQFERSLQLIQGSTLSQEIKQNAKLQESFNLAGVAVEKKDYVGAKKYAEEFRRGAEASKNPAQLKQVHELNGRIAFAQRQNETAIAELEQANEQNPTNLYRLSLAYQAKGDRTKAQEYGKKAAEFNSLPQLNYALIRAKAQKVAAGEKG